MKREIAFITLVILLALSGCSSSRTPSQSPQPSLPRDAPVLTAISLPQPVFKGRYSLEECIKMRRSVRQYSQAKLTLSEVSQLLWATQGVTESGGGRSAPSAGALYPLEVYLVAGKVEGLSEGVYKYAPREHGLALMRAVNLMDGLCSAALNQPAVKNGAIDIVIAAVYERSRQKYGERGTRYSILEAGHAAQNFCLQAAALDLATVTVGAFDDEKVKKIVEMEDGESPLYILAAGRPD